MTTTTDLKAALLDEWLKLDALKATITSPAGTYHDTATGKFTGRPGGKAGGDLNRMDQKSPAEMAELGERMKKLWVDTPAFASVVKRARSIIQENDLPSGMVVYEMDSKLSTIDTDTWLNSNLSKKGKKVATVYSRRIEDAAGKPIQLKALKAANQGAFFQKSRVK